MTSSRKTENQVARHAKSRFLRMLQRMKQATREVPLFTSTFAFWTLWIGAVVIGLFLIGFGLLILQYEYVRSYEVRDFVKFWFACFCLYLAAIPTYLTLTGNWDMFFTWWVVSAEKRRDKFSSVTTSLRLAVMRFGNNERGFFMTMAPETEFPKRADQKITFEDDRHVTLIAGSRAGKGRSVIIPNLLHWRGSTIVYDPSGENYAATAAYRRNVLKQKVILLDPFGVTGEKSDSWNPMAEVDFDHDPQAIDKCYMLAESIHAQSTPDPYWTHAPRKMLAMCMAYVGTRSVPEQCHLGTVRDLLMTAEPEALWLAMSRSESYRGLIRKFGEGNQNRHADELNSTLEISRTAMKWLDSEVMDSFVQQSSFSMRELKEGDTSIYITLPAGQGETYKAWLRLLFNAAFEAMQDTSIPKPENDVLFVMDEFPLLGRMDRIKRAAGEAAKFGVKLFICAQDITQLKEHYGQAWETFVANSGLLIMFANNDLETQTYLSNRLGKEKYTKTSYSSGVQSSSSTTSTELREVARADEVEKQVSRQAGEAFFFPAGHKPLRLPRANYDQWDIFKRQVLQARRRPRDIEVALPIDVVTAAE
ncbi:MAG: type IV secretory system conjugative DNA transfer family protein [Pseudomonadota bacterium]